MSNAKPGEWVTVYARRPLRIRYRVPTNLDHGWAYLALTLVLAWITAGWVAGAVRGEGWWLYPLALFTAWLTASAAGDTIYFFRNRNQENSDD